MVYLSKNSTKDSKVVGLCNSTPDNQPLSRKAHDSRSTAIGKALLPGIPQGSRLGRLGPLERQGFQTTWITLFATSCQPSPAKQAEFHWHARGFQTTRIALFATSCWLAPAKQAGFHCLVSRWYPCTQTTAKGSLAQTGVLCKAGSSKNPVWSNNNNSPSGMERFKKDPTTDFELCTLCQLTVII